MPYANTLITLSRPNLTAVILAAGRGSRLETESDDLPKALLDIDQITMVEIQLSILEAAGIEDIVIVTGYKAQQIVLTVGNRASFVHNDVWDETNSLYSLSLTRDQVQGDLLILNCDVLLHPEILERLLQSGGDAIAYDSSSGSHREHMKVQMEGSLLKAMSKELPSKCCHGENLGLLYFNADTVNILFDNAEALIFEGGHHMWAPAAVERTAQKVDIRGVDVSDLPWIEIDDLEDLEQARGTVWPDVSTAFYGLAPHMAKGDSPDNVEEPTFNTVRSADQ